MLGGSDKWVHTGRKESPLKEVEYILDSHKATSVPIDLHPRFPVPNSNTSSVIGDFGSLKSATLRAAYIVTIT